jgi:hypothetical protein
MAHRFSAIGALALTLTAAPAAADAFCGFYISGAGGELYNNATQVVLMRQGTRTVLSMQNNYQGPPQDFAMVIPVPVVLQETNVKTLPPDIFKRVDQLAAPRLVEYWEQDPCWQPPVYRDRMPMKAGGAPRPAMKKPDAPKDLGVTIEAKFAVAEYQILILSAKDSTGLDTWLRQEGYKIPKGAEPYLRPYVTGGSKFFVAKVDIQKVRMVNGMAALSPLRFHYDSEEFALPIRLGMANSKGVQDLIIHILAPGQRYEVTNLPNAFIPTNIDVRNESRERFGEVYAALFDRTLEKNPNAVITEYSWDAGSCDPCPTPPLSMGDIMTLGADVLNQPMQIAGGGAPPPPPPGPAGGPAMKRPPMPPRPPPPMMRGFVLTRMHARYGKNGIDADLVFKAAPPVMGGREVRSGAGGKLEEGATPSGINNFQARYAIRHEWTGPIACANPVRGRWGGPPSGGNVGIKPALELAFAPRGKARLGAFVRQDVPEIGLVAMPNAALELTPEEQKAAQPKNVADPVGGGGGGGEVEVPPPDDPGTPPVAPQPPRKAEGCGGCKGSDAGAAGLAALIALALVHIRRRKAA